MSETFGEQLELLCLLSQQRDGDHALFGDAERDALRVLLSRYEAQAAELRQARQDLERLRTERNRHRLEQGRAVSAARDKERADTLALIVSRASELQDGAPHQEALGYSKSAAMSRGGARALLKLGEALGTGDGGGIVARIQAQERARCAGLVCAYCGRGDVPVPEPLTGHLQHEGVDCAAAPLWARGGQDGK